MEDAMPLEQIATHVYALVAGNAAQRLEQPIAGQLLRRDGAGVASEPAIEAAARRNERALKNSDGVQETIAVRPVSVGLSELPHLVWIRPQLAQDLLDARRHNGRIAKRLLDFEVERA